MPSPTLALDHVDGVTYWHDPATGWRMPIIAGGQEGDGGNGGSSDGDARDGGDGPTAAAVIVPAGTGDKPPEKPDDGLAEAGRAAIRAERDARKAAEKAMRDAQAEAKALKDATLSEAEKLKQEAEEGKQLAATATGKLRKANLLTSLAEEGFSGARAKAVSRLLDGLEYDDDDEPTNLKQALKAAEKEYGDLVKPQPVATDFDGGARKPATGNSMDDQIRRMAGRNV